MKRQYCFATRRFVAVLCGVIFAGGVAMEASAQAPYYIPGSSAASPSVVVSRPGTEVNSTVDEAAPISPTTSPGPMTLDQCLGLGFSHQPAIDAANASLNAARTGQGALNRLIIPRLFVPDLRIRKQQACVGVSIAAAGLSQAEWETRYSITRNFYTVQYIRMQDEVIGDVLKQLDKSYGRAKKLLDDGNPDSSITAVDLDQIQIQYQIVKSKKAQVENGREKALAALREAMGLGYDFPLEIAAVDLPPAVWSEKVTVKDKDGKPKKDKKGNIEYEEKFHQLYQIDRDVMVQSALALRPEISQAANANRLTDLEIQAQGRIRGWKGSTFAMGSDIHAKPIPQGIFNNEYRPGAIGIEMPPLLVGRMKDRMQRAADLNDRSVAVVDKTTNLVSLDVEAQYLKWREAVAEVRELSEIRILAEGLPTRVLELDPRNYTSSAIIQSNMTAITVRTQLNDAKHMHALALAGLERATAGAFHIYPIPEVPLPMPSKKD